VKLKETLKIGRILCKEAIFKASFERRMFKGDLKTAIKLSLRDAKLSKLSLIGIFIFLSIYLSFLRSNFFNPREALFFDAALITLYLILSFFLIFFMGLNLAISMYTSKIFLAINHLPISPNDLAKLPSATFTSFFDIPLILLIIPLSIFYGYVSKSVFAGLSILFVSLINISIAFLCIAWFSKIFYNKFLVVAPSKAKSILRIFFMFLWVLGSAGIGFMWFMFASRPSTINLIVAFFKEILVSNKLVCLIYPLPLSLAASLTVNLKLYLVFTLHHYLLLLTSLIFYTFLGFFGVKLAGKILTRICTGEEVKFSRKNLKSVEKVWIRFSGGIFKALILKDLKIMSRDPSQILAFVLPIVFMLSIIFPIIGKSNVDLTDTFFLFSGLAAIFAFLTPYILGGDVSSNAYPLTLPLSLKTIIFSKALLVILVYTPTLMVLTAFLIVKTFSFPIFLILFLAFQPAIIAGIFFELYVAFKVGGETLTINVPSNLVKLIPVVFVGLMVSLSPLIFFIAAYNLVGLESLTLILPLTLSLFLLIIAFLTIHIGVKG